MTKKFPDASIIVVKNEMRLGDGSTNKIIPIDLLFAFFIIKFYFRKYI